VLDMSMGRRTNFSNVQLKRCALQLKTFYFDALTPKICFCTCTRLAIGIALRTRGWLISGIIYLKAIGKQSYA